MIQVDLIDLISFRAHVLREAPVPVDVVARLLEAGVDVKRLEKLYIKQRKPL